MLSLQLVLLSLSDWKVSNFWYKMLYCYLYDKYKARNILYVCYCQKAHEQTKTKMLLFNFTNLSVSLWHKGTSYIGLWLNRQYFFLNPFFLF